MNLSIRRFLVCITFFLAALPTLFSQDYDWALLGDDGRIYVTNHKENNTDEDGDYIFYMPENFGVLDNTGKVLIDGKNRWVKKVAVNRPVYVAFGEKDKGDGVMDADFNVIIPAQYFELSVFGDYAAARKADGDNTTIFRLPEMKKMCVVPAKYHILNISDGMIRAYTEEDSYCFFNLDGKMAIPHNALKGYVDVSDFQDGRASVTNQKEQLGFIDKKGKLVIPCQYQCADYEEALNDQGFHNGLCAVEKDDKWGMIDINGKIVVPFIFSGFIDNSGDEIKALSYNETKERDEFMVIDAKGETLRILPDEYYQLSDGMVIFADEVSGFSGYKNLEGKVVISPYFEYAFPFVKDVALVYLNGSVSLINKEGKIIVPHFAYWSLNFMPG